MADRKSLHDLIAGQRDGPSIHDLISSPRGGGMEYWGNRIAQQRGRRFGGEPSITDITPSTGSDLAMEIREALGLAQRGAMPAEMERILTSVTGGTGASKSPRGAAYGVPVASIPLWLGDAAKSAERGDPLNTLGNLVGAAGVTGVPLAGSKLGRRVMENARWFGGKRPGGGGKKYRDTANRMGEYISRRDRARRRAAGQETFADMLRRMIGME